MDRDGRHVRRLGARGPGEDPDDPYADVDASELPEWWRRAKREFEAHGLRPYRPPRFEDGTLKYEVVDDLEDELGVELTFTSLDSAYTEEWEIRVDGDVVGHVGRFRSPEGYTAYEMGSDDFAELVRSAVGDR